MNGHFTFYGDFAHWDSYVPVKYPWTDPFRPKALLDLQNTYVETFQDPFTQVGNPVEAGVATAQPFILAMPHQSMSWMQTFGDPNDQSVKKHQYKIQIKQFDLAKEQLQQQLQQIETFRNKLQEELEKLDEPKN